MKKWNILLLRTKHNFTVGDSIDAEYGDYFLSNEIRGTNFIGIVTEIIDKDKFTALISEDKIGLAFRKYNLDTMVEFKYNHGFKIGQCICVIDDEFILGCADNLLTSWVKGIVVRIVDENRFVLYFCGYHTFPEPLFDDEGDMLFAGKCYVLSSKTPGALTKICPKICTPIFVCDSMEGNRGYIHILRPAILED